MHLRGKCFIILGELSKRFLWYRIFADVNIISLYVKYFAWWRHQMETFSTLPAPVRWIHRWPVNSPHKGQWRGTLMFSFICVGDLRRHRAHYDITVMVSEIRSRLRVGDAETSSYSLSGVPDFFDRNKILSCYDLSHYQVPHCIRVFFYFVWFVFIHHNF